MVGSYEKYSLFLFFLCHLLCLDIFVSVLCVCKCIPHVCRCPQRPEEGVRCSGAGATDMWVLGTELQPTGPLLYSHSSVCLGSNIICLFPKQSNWISQICHHNHSRTLLDWMRQSFTHANKGFHKFLGKWPVLYAAPPPEVQAGQESEHSGCQGKERPHPSKSQKHFGQSLGKRN